MLGENKRSSGESLDDILKVAESCAAQGQRVLLDYFGHLTQVGWKEQGGLVSEADLESERVICEEIRKNFPGHLILAEEESFKKLSKGREDPLAPRWIIDPLDGTTNYVHGLPIFCISIGFEVEGKVQMGVIDVPILKKRYSAIRGRGAFCNGKKLSVSTRNSLTDSLLATVFFSDKSLSLEEQLRIFSGIVKKCRGVRRMGAAVYDLCMVAEGVFDAFWEVNLSPWDTAAGSLLVTEAGGQVTDYNGTPFHPEMKSILATNKLIHSDCQSHIQRHSPTLYD